ncbi:MAG: hypothetical protein ABJC26_16335 [Gemmatimonadaceae bacterium]
MNAIALDDSRLLDTWDRSAVLDRPWRELALLESACGIPFETLARLSIGERDRLLLGLRIGTFGKHLECETACPSCGTRLQLAFDASQLIVPQRSVSASELEFTDAAWTVRFRLPNSADLAACSSNEAGAESAADVLRDRCITVISPEQSTTSSALPNRLRERVAERMSVLDPQADVSLNLNCASCNHEWQAPFDPAAFLLREVDSYATRLTVEVHQLARAYGWSEASILEMGPVRRRRYLSLLLQ